MAIESKLTCIKFYVDPYHTIEQRFPQELVGQAVAFVIHCGSCIFSVSQTSSGDGPRHPRERDDYEKIIPFL